MFIAYITYNLIAHIIFLIITERNLLSVNVLPKHTGSEKRYEIIHITNVFVDTGMLTDVFHTNC